MYCIEEKTCDVVGTFWRLRHCDPLPSLVTPLVWHFATKHAAVKFAEPWMSNHFSELRDHSYVASAMRPEYPMKAWRGKSFWPNPWPRDRPAPGEITTSLAFAWSRLCVEPVELPENCCWPWGTPSTPKAAAPTTLPGGKAGMKMNEMNNIYVI